ncbi:DUF362 domain-containing protein [Candidatus Poribacteria bacterium]|nr:DUF362 domain-containing protein [Candidatus Poribacteria bacterium]
MRGSSEPHAGGAIVSLVKSESRSAAIRRAIDLLGTNPVQRKKVVLKPNFNSAHEFPGSTHPDTLRTLIGKLSEMGATAFTVADRSGMGDTVRVMEEKGIPALGSEMDFESIALDRLADDAWKPFEMKDSHWQNGLYFPKLFLEAESLVQTCCLKTHRFGGHFTLSLKNSVGMVARVSPKDGYNFMGELHGSRDQRRMIAEINQLYQPDLIVLDAMEGFVDAGPEAGKRVQPGVVIAGTDRIAVDAVGVAILRLYGTTPVVTEGAIFEQEQIRRAVEVGVGVDAPEKITVVVPDEVSGAFAAKLTPILGMKTRTASAQPTGNLPTSWGEMKRA